MRERQTDKKGPTPLIFFSCPPSFVKSFDDRAPDPDRDAALVQAFLTAQDAAIAVHPVWAGATPSVRAHAAEALEKYVLSKIHGATFGVSALDRERDAALAARLKGLAFVGAAELDVPPARADPAALERAASELRRMDDFKAPRDKLVCGLNACRIVANLLAAEAASGGAAATDPRGADDFLPLLILALIRAAPPRLASNLEYVQRYRGAARFGGEAAYFFTQLYSAASFVETVNTASLTVDPAVFVERMRAAGVPDLQLLPGPEVAPPPTAGAAATTTAAGPPPLAPRPPPPTVADLEREGAPLLAAADAGGELAAAHPWLYVASAADLPLGDVPRLLAAYKETVLRLEAVTRAVEARASASAAAGVAGVRLEDAPAAASAPAPASPPQAVAAAAAGAADPAHLTPRAPAESLI